MNLLSRRGDATLIVVAVLGLAALLGWSKPWKLFTSKPPLAALATAQANLDAANAKAKAAEDALTAAQVADAKAKNDQLQYAQQMVHGVSDALQVAPMSPEVQVAASLSVRAETSLAAAIGSLPPALAQQIDAAVQTALAAKDHEIAALNATLVSRDADLKAVTGERDTLKVQIPILSNQVVSAQKVVAADEAVVVAKQAQVNTYAAKAAAADSATFGWQGIANGAKHTLYWIVGLVALYLVLKDLVLPSLAQEFPASKVIQWFYRVVTSLTSAHVTTATPTPPTT